jgi:hypothetical protein
MTPDPNCSTCKGTGFITLLTSRKPCGCERPMGAPGVPILGDEHPCCGEPDGYTVKFSGVTNAIADWSRAALVASCRPRQNNDGTWTADVTYEVKYYDANGNEAQS